MFLVNLLKFCFVEKHPDSDHLMICQLSVGQEEPVQIVTGAPNITAETVGRVRPAALDKTTLPGGVKITKGKLRGVASNGMMCSFQELGLDLGCVPYAVKTVSCSCQRERLSACRFKMFWTNEDVVEFEITSNRPDRLSVIGLARETALNLSPSICHQRASRWTGCGDDIGNYILRESRNRNCVPAILPRS